MLIEVFFATTIGVLTLLYTAKEVSTLLPRVRHYETHARNEIKVHTWNVNDFQTQKSQCKSTQIGNDSEIITCSHTTIERNQLSFSTLRN